MLLAVKQTDKESNSVDDIIFSVGEAFLGPLCSYAFPVSGANASDVSALANHTTAQQGQEQGTSVNITTANVAVAHEAGAELLEQAMATSLTTRQKQELVLKLSSAKYLAMDLMAAYCGLQFFDNHLSPFHIRCEQLADLMLNRLGILQNASSSDELNGLQDKLTSLLLQASAMGELLLALRDFERRYMQRHLTDICSMATSQEAVLYFCQVIEVRFESTLVAMTQLILKTAKTIRHLGITPPRTVTPSFPLPANASENEVRIRVLAGIHEVRTRIDELEVLLELC